ncbi:MAG: DUF364 domain-containing protein [Desulfoplanes sp.]|nr:DUF364 domain-containing protein [Desulfoplanes sp.]
MRLEDEFRKIITKVTAQSTIPPIEKVFFPPFYKGGQPRDAEFMAISLEGGAAGLSFVLLPDSKGDSYMALQPSDFIGKDPQEYALEFGSDDPLKQMLSLACINAICQQAMQESHFEVDSSTDSLGLLSISKSDRVGMVGLFPPLIKTIRNVGAQFVVVEKKADLIKQFPHLPITLDAAELQTCNKILCTSTTVLNNSLDDILAHRSLGALVAVIGPTAGYFPDPLFARGVDVVGGRMIKNGNMLIQRLEQGERWGDATQRTCFRKETYTGIL